MDMHSPTHKTYNRVTLGDSSSVVMGTLHSTNEQNNSKAPADKKMEVELLKWYGWYRKPFDLLKIDDKMARPVNE